MSEGSILGREMPLCSELSGRHTLFRSQNRRHYVSHSRFVQDDQDFIDFVDFREFVV